MDKLRNIRKKKSTQKITINHAIVLSVLLLANHSVSADTTNSARQSGSVSDKRDRSPQGINNGAENRRRNALKRFDRNFYTPKRIRGHEVREFDGTGNNRRNPTWGASFQHLQRIAEADYGDGVSTLAGASRKSARVISNTIFSQDREDIPNSFNTSDYIWQWGQFIDHDVGLTDGSTDEAINIPVPPGDVFTSEIPVNRAIFDPETGTGVDNPREQENEITSWIDGSMVYGSSDERADALREGPDSPFLATSGENLLPLNSDNLPNASGPIRDPAILFLAGDVRVNEQIGLTAMHTLFVREHNRVARQLQLQFPHFKAEEIFQSARRIVIAEIQKITYDEFLPALLGPDTMPSYRGYNPGIRPDMFNEFTVAAYRFGHSSLSPNILTVDENGIENPVELRNAFFNAHNIFTEEDSMDPILRGLANQLHQPIDSKVVDDLRNFLFGEPGQGGFDLVSLNIQRGRDHGVASYNDTRAALGLSRASSFADITSDTDVQNALEEAYDYDVDNIDLWVGGLAEDPLTSTGSQLGELFTTILVRQFDAVRAADRFWHERDLNDVERRFVRNTTLSEVIRNNTNIGNELQRNVFFVRPNRQSQPAPSAPGRPVCQSAASDPDGDGFGWENNATCLVSSETPQTPQSQPTPSAPGLPVCLSAASDSDGDGFGWENNASCLVANTSAPDTGGSNSGGTNTGGTIFCESAESDPDGDGWGWENSQSCLVR